MLRIGVGGIWQETNTFVPRATTLRDFENYLLAEGPALLDAVRGTGTELGGAVAFAEQNGVLPVPLCFGAALPSGVVDGRAFATMLRALVGRARSAGPLDGVVLALHGAMVVEGCPDPELRVVTALRDAIGDVPVAVTLDYHANVGPDLPRAADFLVGYRTYPHVDMAERGAEAVELLVRRIGRPRRTPYAFRKLPLLTVPLAQEGSAEPMRSLLRAVGDLTRRPGVWTASALPGFAYGEGDRLGFGVYVSAADGAHGHAADLAEQIWSQRENFTCDLVDADAAARATMSGPGPVVLVDVADNVGGGSPGDGTAILHALAAAGAHGSVSVLWDPVAVAAAERTYGELVALPVGGRSDPSMGTPFVLSGPARRLGRVGYTRTGSYMRGQRVDMGRVVVVDAPIGTVVLTEHRVVPFDDDHLRVLGVEPRAARSLVAKGAIAWKAAFGGYAARTLHVRTPGYCPAALDQLRYRHRPTPLFPLERDPAWEAAVAAGLRG
ncbi:M81 family metallopeptidase [Streptomyces sp. NPDC056716]|uniref:M81 family metallopeptidase n=1 Tax=unclassified Streptomyces TaxID=2593676 RepID=UPI0036D09575